MESVYIPKEMSDAELIYRVNNIMKNTESLSVSAVSPLTPVSAPEREYTPPKGFDRFAHDESDVNYYVKESEERFKTLTNLHKIEYSLVGHRLEKITVNLDSDEGIILKFTNGKTLKIGYSSCEGRIELFDCLKKRIGVI